MNNTRGIIGMAEYIAILISIIALCYTVYTNIKTNKFMKKVEKEQIMSVFFMKLYFETLTIELPELINSFYQQTDIIGKKEVVEKIDVELINLLDKSLFYKYNDNKFYLKLVKIISESQDLVFQTLDTLDRGVYREAIVAEKWDSSISNLYTTMTSYYSSI